MNSPSIWQPVVGDERPERLSDVSVRAIFPINRFMF
jgi:hypothetical protein